MIRRTAGNATSFGTPKAKSFVQAKAHRDRPLSEAERARNRMKPKVRVKVEHAFLVVAGGRRIVQSARADSYTDLETSLEVGGESRRYGRGLVSVAVLPAGLELNPRL